MSCVAKWIETQGEMTHKETHEKRGLHSELKIVARLCFVGKLVLKTVVVMRCFALPRECAALVEAAYRQAKPVACLRSD